MVKAKADSALSVIEETSAIALDTKAVVGTLNHWNDEQITLIKSQIAKGCSDAELELFGQVCQRTGLDPFSRQIYAVMRNQFNPETRTKEPRMTIQVSIDGFRTIAARSGYYGGSSTEWCDTDGVWLDIWLKDHPPAGARTTVYRLGCDRPFVGACTFKSYAQSFNGKLSSFWEKMPDTMIGKVSEAIALRKAFPAELSGLYTTEEMAQADNDRSFNSKETVDAAVVNGQGVAWEQPNAQQGIESVLLWAGKMLKQSPEQIAALLESTPADANGKKGAVFINRVESIWSQN